MTRVLYISYDGMTDPLGQSQVIPYLIGLSEAGYEFHLISCEKKEKFISNRNSIQELLSKHGIEWHPLTYTKRPPVLSTVWDINKLKQKAHSLHRKHNFTIIHCRSYIASIIGLWLKRKFDAKFIFDMRGFWADERVEGNLWNIKNPLYKAVYLYFKKKEKEFLSNSDYTISLTEAAKKEIHSWKYISNQPIPIQVIPCCADTELFNPDKINKDEQEQYKIKLGINDSDFILSYLGALGTWYLLDEMLFFFKELLKSKANSKFLFITQEQPEVILEKAKSLNIGPKKIIIHKAKRAEVPMLLSLSSLSILFIKPVFSKKASSPTKLGEIMSMGIPFITGRGIGDIEQIVSETNAGIVINKFSSEEYAKSIQQLGPLLAKDKNEIRKSAILFFSLKKGVESYHAIYRQLSAKKILDSI